MTARGEIHLASLDPAVAHEQGKVRPVIIVSNNAANSSADRRGRGVVTVVPVTTNVANVYPFQVFLSREQTGLPADSKAQAEQVRSISTDRLIRRVATLPAELVGAVDDALRLHLAL
ncbi:MAG: type II toxin-antitoxin system PemK/MazF family toxin [Salinibacterium sp.]|nr:type II toxin-antitoxin system PemK/MazF family toxin [Salinibacterium sp.]MBF0673208.1 type II toxin-antitoxin system PemK/MazF family toxin [Salinibacterium sp.]